MQFKQQYREGESTKDSWCTPDYIFEPLNSVFRFTVDAAANSDNSKCPEFMEDGLEESWQNRAVWCNPPYTSGQYGEWIRKASKEWLEGTGDFVLLLPASWETKAFEPVWKYATYLIFPYSRIKFELDGEPQGGAPFSSLIAVFTERILEEYELDILTEIGRVIDLEDGYANRHSYG